jgi:O-antigen/teichoic acid export membrane protein
LSSAVFRLVNLKRGSEFFKKGLVKQFMSLASIQVVNLFIPLLIIPYVSRILGPEKIGLINFATSFLTYFTLIVNYGFDLSATREISLHREDMNYVNEIVNTTLFCKALLFVLSSICYFAIVLLSKKYSSELNLYFVSYLLLISSVFYSAWLFQGLQKLQVFTFYNLVFRILSIGFIFFLVRTKNDYNIYQLISGLAAVLTAMVTLQIARKRYQLKYYTVSFNKIIYKIKSSFALFLSVVIVNFNTTSTIILLGFLTNYLIVGYYTAAMKVYSVVASLSLFPLNQVMYPHMAQEFKKSKENGIEFIRKIIPRILFVFSLVSVLLIICSKMIIQILYGDQFADSVNLLKILAPLLVLSTLVNIICYQVMLNLKMDRYFLGINAVGFLVNIVLSLMLVPVFKAYGTCCSLYLIEVTIILVSLAVLRRNKIKLF